MATFAYRVKATYKGFSQKLDGKIFKVAGSISEGSGYNCNSGERDHCWYFERRAGAGRLAARLNNARLDMGFLAVVDAGG